MIALAATLHDHTGALAADVDARLADLRALYPAGIMVATSPPTAAAVVERLVRDGVHAGSPAANERGPLYRLAMRGALASGATHVHYLDFDRALHWIATRPREHAAVLRLARDHDALLVGRTERAHRTHHRPLYATELVANRVMADRLGWTGRIDFLVPSFVLAREAAMRLVRASRARSESLYGEWAALLVAGSASLAYVECGGLEWETPDRHRAAVAALGLSAWRAAQDTAQEWRLRTTMATAIVRGFERVLARAGGGAPVLQRLRSPSS